MTINKQTKNFGMPWKNTEMVVDAAKQSWDILGFDRTVYGNKKIIGTRKWRWLQELRQEREKDIRTEMT